MPVVLPVGLITPLVGGTRPLNPRSPFSVCIHPGSGAAAPIEVQLTGARRTTRSTCGLQYPGVGGEGVGRESFMGACAVRRSAVSMWNVVIADGLMKHVGGRGG
jgi:hypothetical protein